MPRRCLRGEEIQLLLILDLSTRWGSVVTVMPQLHFSLGEEAPLPIVQEAGWAPEPVWTQRLEEKSFRLCQGSNLNRPVIQPVAKHYTDWDTWLTHRINTHNYFWWTDKDIKCYGVTDLAWRPLNIVFHIIISTHIQVRKQCTAI
jgi:hypothetical protein